MNSLIEEQYVKIFPDWEATGVWSKNGCNVPAEWLPVTQDILDDIEKMQYDFNCGDFNVDEDNNLTTEWDCDDDWDKRVKDIAARIRLQLPDWTVIDCTKNVC